MRFVDEYWGLLSEKMIDAWASFMKESVPSETAEKWPYGYTIYQ